MEWCTMLGDLDWPPNASRMFVSISSASCYSAMQIARTCYGNVAVWVGCCLSQPVLCLND